MMAALVTLGAWAGTDEVIVTRQLTLAQRKKLPEKTIQLDVKRVTMARKADTAFYNALVELLDTVAEADWSNRTFVVILDQRGDKVKIAIHSDDILTNAAQRDGYWGDLQRDRCHFVLLINKENQPLLQQHFKQQGKVRFVQEFEFVNFPTPPSPTSVLATWTPTTGLHIVTRAINGEDQSSGRVEEKVKD